MKEVKTAITTEYIKLDQLLKFSGAAQDGAEAKSMILSGMVSFPVRLHPLKASDPMPPHPVSIVTLFRFSTVRG